MSSAISYRDESPAVPAAAPAVVPLDYATASTPHGSPLRPLVLPHVPEPRATRIAWVAVALAVAALYLHALLSFAAPAHPGVDQNGYFVGGRQFAQTFSTGMKPQSPYAFIGRMWVREPETEWNYPKYPLGLPILFAGCIWLFGERGYELAHFISPAASALALLGVFAIVRRIAGGFAGVLAMLLMGCGQVMLTLSINPNSHAAGTCAVVWGFFFLLRWLESRAVWRGVLSGLLLGFAYMIRYTDGLMLLTLVVGMLYAARWGLPSQARLIGTIAGGAAGIGAMALVAKFTGSSWMKSWPFLTPLAEDGGVPFKLLLASLAAATVASLFVQGRALWRLLVVGTAWLVPVVYLTLFNMTHMRAFTSYAGTNESTGFSLSDFNDNWEKMIRVLHDQGLFFIAPIGVLGLLVMFRRMPLVATLLTLWFVPSVLLYTAYYWAPDNMGVSYSRFILTQLPALVIAAAWLMGEVSRRLGAPAGIGVGRRLARRHDSSMSTIAAAASVVGFAAVAIVGVAAIAYGVWAFDAARDGAWWAIVVPGAILFVWGALGLPSIASPRWGERFDHHFARATTRLAVGFVVFVSCSLGVARTLVGSEWGQRIQARANIEFQSRQNNNLAGLGREVARLVRMPPRDENGGRRPAVPDEKVVLFADGERLHHLQWIGGWQLFDVNAFNAERMNRGLWRQASDESDPDPIDPSRVKFLREVYKGKDQRALQAEQGRLIEDAIRGGGRVFVVLSETGTRQVERQLDRRRFEVKRAGGYTDMPSPRRPEEFLPPDQRPRPPVNRFGRNAFNNANFFPGLGRETLRVSEVLLKTPATAPTTGPS